ncbi:hypothetical protein BDFB_010368 [Asbolus verrucosus]|uniref:Uncharacterized protein n=1 Tax=Asbolus verrucosus TaxID=1661398 RepID=A0A482VKW3_ASBVE|nr:hypothetical protein BDFB_010368 [Asbolus verrucosus]
MALPYEFSAETIIDEGRCTRRAVNEVRDWLLTTSLPEIPEELIVLFLLSCRNVVADTQSTIRAYFRIKSGAPEIFDGRDIDGESLKKAAETV